MTNLAIPIVNESCILEISLTTYLEYIEPTSEPAMNWRRNWYMNVTDSFRNPAIQVETIRIFNCIQIILLLFWTKTIQDMGRNEVRSELATAPTDSDTIMIVDADKDTNGNAIRNPTIKLFLDTSKPQSADIGIGIDLDEIITTIITDSFN